MSDIPLSKAVRSNLLSLQSTANLMAKTQERLATGNKVNSALDNPTNFFTASALNSRARDMNSLMDSMANGIQTLEAADNGLSSITKTLESMQSTLRQARQDKSFQMNSYTLDPNRMGTLSFRGGAVGDNPIDVNLTRATPASITGGIEYKPVGSTAPEPFTAAGAGGGVYPIAGLDVEAVDLTFGIKGNKDAAQINFVINEDTAGIADPTKLTLSELVSITNAKLADYGSSVRARDNGGKFELYETDATNVGLGAHITMVNGATATNAEDIGFLAAQLGAVPSAAIGKRGVDEASYTFTLDGDTSADGTGEISITLNGDTHDTPQKAADFINVKLREAVNGTDSGLALSAQGLRASVNNGKLVISGPADGSPKTILIDGGTPGADAISLFGDAATHTVEFGSPDSGPAKTVDELVTELNATNRLDGTPNPLKGKIRASNDNGKLRIENLSTTDLTIDGVGSDGRVDGASTGVASIEGNSVRTGLASQFNELRDQLDKIADDASFNGINLLRGDLLKITFNETGTSSIDISTKGEVALNSSTLNLYDLIPSNLDSDDDIDAFLAEVKTALNHVRTQSSTFGSNLSIVQNRQDFTKEMINTLQTGAANLTLADMNEEAANLLALQTRQSLSSSSLSLASQADQSVLQLLQ